MKLPTIYSNKMIPGCLLSFAAVSNPILFRTSCLG